MEDPDAHGPRGGVGDLSILFALHHGRHSDHDSEAIPDRRGISEGVGRIRR